jgi:hypothetical protein
MNLKQKRIFSSVALLCLAFLACGQPSSQVDSGTDAGGPCNPASQSGCGANEKCTLRLDNGQPGCAAKGAATAYAPCSADSECVAGTTCITLPASLGFETGQVCHPVCTPPTQAHLACAMGGTCEVVDTAATDYGFCARPKSDGGTADGG